MEDLNSSSYWDRRFRMGDWSLAGGTVQSYEHAIRYVPHLGLDADFSGRLCDFGCAQGDSFPVYASSFPRAQLLGIDFSITAIQAAERRYGHLASFRCGDAEAVPPCDVIVSSHTFEHLEDDRVVLDLLLEKCSKLFVIVPYREEPLAREHLRFYDESTFADYCPQRMQVSLAGWRYRGAKLWYHVHLKNVLRQFLGRRPARQPKQITYEFEGRRGSLSHP